MIPYLIILFLFALSVAALVWAAWLPGRVTRKRILCTLALAALAYANALMLITQRIPFV